MTNTQNEDKRVAAINDLIFLESVKEELWKYHPENPNKMDVKDEFDAIEVEIQKQRNLIDTL